MLSDPQSAAAYHELVSLHAGSARRAFSVLAAKCARRFFAQAGRVAPSDAWLDGFLAAIWDVAEETGWPRPLPDDDQGEPAEMPAMRAAELVAKVFALAEAGDRRAECDTLARQLLKTCLQPEFRECRESYREVVNGICRRQKLEKVRERVSGSHCVDCPYWVALEPDPHAAMLEKEWVAGGGENFRAQREVFLPEDFRAVRRFVWWHVRLRA